MKTTRTKSLTDAGRLSFSASELFSLAYAARDRYHRTAQMFARISRAHVDCGDLFAKDAAEEHALTERLSRVAFPTSPNYAPGF